MRDLAAEIATIEADKFTALLIAVLRRYEELFPGWEISTITLPKKENRNEMIDNTIELLQKMERWQTGG